MSQLFDCVIVGGGIAGVRAAQAAAKNGLTYKVLEANSYLGMFYTLFHSFLLIYSKTVPIHNHLTS